jgi:hypothetical protein
MLKSLFILALTSGLCSCGGDGSGNTSNHGAIGYYTVGQSGTNCSPWGDGSSTDQPAMAVKFTPLSYPVTITSVTIYAVNNTGSNQYFNIYGYSDLLAEKQIL